MKILVFLLACLCLSAKAEEPIYHYELTELSQKMIVKYNSSFGFDYKPIRGVIFDVKNMGDEYMGLYVEESKTIYINPVLFQKNISGLDTIAHEVAHHLGYDHEDPVFYFMVNWLMDSVYNELDVNWYSNNTTIFHNMLFIPTQ